jgi:hypothetical protein
MTNDEAAYIAGFIDGEGCISIYPCNSKKDNPSFTPRIIITNLDSAVLAWIQEIVGGGNLYKKKKYKEHHRQAYSLQLTAGVTIPLLKRILPYLKVKTKQAKLALALDELPNARNKELKDKVLEIYREMTALNKWPTEVYAS